jgi:hypothetical protein
MRQRTGIGRPRLAPFAGVVSAGRSLLIRSAAAWRWDNDMRAGPADWHGSRCARILFAYMKNQRITYRRKSAHA